MFTWVAPEFLVAGIALVIPLVLHLIQSSRTMRLPFSTIRFLKLAAKRSSRRIKMEHFLLWLLRTLLLAALVAAFAMPMIRTKEFNNLLGRVARDVAIVLDGSYSMGYTANGKSTWTEATDLAAEIISGLSEKDRFCVYLANNQVTPIYEQLTGAKEREAAGKRLKALTLGYESSQLAPALVAANKMLEQEQRHTEREIYIITDTQALPWDSFKRDAKTAPEHSRNMAGTQTDAKPKLASAPDSQWDPTQIGENTACFVTLLGSPSPENTSPVEISLEPNLITPDTMAKLTVKIARTGPAQDTTAIVCVDDKEVARRSAMIAGSGEIKFVLPPLRAGTHAARVETPEDNLARDNAFHFLIRVREKLPVLCVGSPEGAFFLRAALATGVGGGSPIETKLISPDRLAEEQLSSHVAVFLCNALPLSGQGIVRLEQYVRAGGLAVLFPGDAAKTSEYAAWSCLPGAPTAITELPLAARKRLLTWEKPKHPFVAALKEGGLAPTLNIKRSLRFDSFNEKASALVSTGAGNPFLANMSFGRGEVFMFAVSADREWSDFPLSPFYLPMAHQLVQYAAGVGVFTPCLWTTESLPLQEYLPEATRESALKNPDGELVSVRSAVVDGQTVLQAEGLTVPGIYSVSAPTDRTARPGLAFNMSRTESDLTPIRAEAVNELLGVKNSLVVTSREELFRRLEERRVGKTLGEQALWLALCLAAVETIYANWLARKRSKLSDHLTIEPSGKLARKD